MSSDLLEERRGRVLVLTINRPDKMNSLSPEIMLRLGDRLNELAGSDEVRCVVVTGAGGKAFSSGYDIGRIPGRGEGQEGPRRNPLEYGLEAIANFPYPVVAAIRGFALGAGLHLALACDLRVATPESTFGMPPVKLGVVYPLEGYALFVRSLGVTGAKALFLTGRRFTSEEALHLGILTHVEPDSTFDAYVEDLAREIAEENAPLAVKGAKRILNRLALGPPSPEDEAEARHLMAAAFQSADALEARRAFAEKRKPQFSGR